MTIDEAIEEMKYNTELDCDINDMREQIAEFLEELKAYKSANVTKETFEKMKSKSYKKGYRQGYNKDIDDFAGLLKGNLVRKYANGNLTQQYVALQVIDWCNEIAERLKAGEEE